MSKPLTLGALLLLTTAFHAPAALAQSAAPQASATDTAAPEAEGGAPQDGEQQVEISLPGVDLEEEIVVTGNIPNVVRATPEVVSVLSAEDIARTGEGDIAGALQRVTGLSVVGNGFVYVRGLGDRYSLALLNGLALPSPEPLRRVVPLDIFPTSVLASSLVQKSYSVNYPGEFGGGVINLTTSAIPREGFVSIGASVNGDTETTGHFGYTHFGSHTDWLGFDNGRRSVPPLLQQAFRAGALINEGEVFSRSQIQDMAASLTNSPTSLVQRTGNIPANLSTDISGGTSWDMGDARFGLIAAAGYSNGWKTRDAIQETTGGSGIGSSFRVVRTDNRVVVNGLLGLGAEFGEHDVRWTNLFIRDTLKQTRLGAGHDIQIGDPVAGQPAQQMRQGTAWFERQLINSQLVAELDFGAVELDLRGGYANSKRNAPYERSFSYLYSNQVNDYVNNLTSGGQSANISFSELDEDVYNVGADVAYKIPGLSGVQVAAGFSWLDTHRQSERRDFAFRPANGLRTEVTQLRPDYLLSDYSIHSFDILLVETSALAGAAAYTADLEVLGAYGQVTADLTDAIRVNAGLRYEDGKQGVTLVDLFGQGVNQTPAIEKAYWLPAATITWNLQPDMQVRLNASKTLARPQFRELAPQIYLDTESDRTFIGNPFIVDSELFNAEARYEWYFDRGQRFSLAGFYKKLDRPIEAVATFAGGGALQTTFANAPRADLYGVEVELQKYWPLEGLGASLAPYRLVTIANYTFTQSALRVRDGDTTILNDNRGPRPASEVFGDGDSLTGQSEHIANLQLGIENTERLAQATLLLTYASDRVTNRGPLLGQTRQADIMERPGLRLDFVARQGIDFLNRELELKAEVRNITGTSYSEFQQQGVRVRTNEYDVGTSLSLGVGMKF